MNETTQNISLLRPPLTIFSSQQFANVIDFLPDAIFITDLNGQVIAWNQALENMTGIWRQEVVGKPPGQYKNIIYGHNGHSLADDLLNKENGTNQGFQCIKRDHNSISGEQWLPAINQGEGGWAWLSAALLKDGDSNNYGVIQTIRDINHQKNTERSLLRVNRALTALSDVNHALLHTSTESRLLQDIVELIVHKNGYCNAWIAFLDSGTEQLNMQAHAGFDRTGRDVMVSCEGKRFGCAPIGSALDARQHFLIRNIKQRPGCEKCGRDASLWGYTSTLALPLVFENHTLGVLNIYAKDEDAFNDDEVILLEKLADNLAFGIIYLRTRNERDDANQALQDAHDHLEHKVTERTKELVSANERLKELDRLKSMFIASMSHELRTPLNSIIGFSGILLNGMTGQLSDKQKNHIERIYSSGKHLMELISDVIDIAKIEGDKIDIFPSYISLDEVLEEIIANFRTLAEKKGLNFRREGNKEVRMFTDRKRILQAISNLVSNAIKYTEAGEITIKVSEYYGTAQVSVIDTGIGIAEHELPKLFGAFERLESHLKIIEGGTGLGLYLTQKLVTEILGGEIEVESEPGRGSKFTIRAAMDLRDL